MTTRKAGKKPSEIIVQQIDIRQIARTKQDIASWRLALQAAESITSPNRTRLYDLYSDILLDGHLNSVIHKRKLAVTNTPVNFLRDGEEDQMMSKLVSSPWFVRMLDHILDARFWGHTCLEFLMVSPDDIQYALVPRKHVIPEKGLITKMQAGQTGWLFREEPLVRYIVEAGEKDDLGILLKAAQYVIYKRNGFADYAQYCELFGMPIRIGKYDPMDEQGRQQLQQTLDEAGSALSVTIPNTAEIEFQETGTTSGSNTLYRDFINSCNAEISKLVLGQTLTTEQGDKGARSLGEVHLDVEQQIHMDDRIYVKNWLNFVFKKFLEIHGFKVADGEFDFVDAERVDLEKRIEIDMNLRDFLPVDDDYFYETYGLPKPTNYEELKKEKQQQKQQQPQPPLPGTKKTEPVENKQTLATRIRSFFPWAPR